MMEGVCSQAALAQLFLLQLMKVRMYIVYIHMYIHEYVCMYVQYTMSECLTYSETTVIQHLYNPTFSLLRPSHQVLSPY